MIALINSVYKKVSSNATFLYYQGLFDLRYQYKFDQEYGYLVALPYPLSLLIIPTIPIAMCLKRRDNQFEKSKALNLLI